MNKLSLRLRITIITGVIITTIALLLTLTSIQNAQKSYLDPFKSNASNKSGISISEKGISINGKNGILFNFDNNGIKVKDNDGAITSLDKSGIHIYSEAATKQFTNQSILLMITIVIMGIAVTYFVTGFTLKPLQNLNLKIKNIDEKNLNERIDNNGSKDEIGSLTDSFNYMLDRLELSFLNQKGFAANASHELKTPLAIIKTGIQVLKLENAPSINDYKENLEITEQSTNRLIKVVDDLLLLYNEDSYTFEETVPTKEIFSNIYNELKPIADNFSIIIDMNVEPCYIKGNRSLLYQVFYNLIENSIKYNKKGGYVKILSSLANNTFIIRVSDNGIGIPSDSLSSIFEPFYRVDKSRSREIGSSGLGLSLVKTIIEKHKGAIEVESILDLGTTFTVTLPIQ